MDEEIGLSKSISGLSELRYRLYLWSRGHGECCLCIQAVVDNIVVGWDYDVSLTRSRVVVADREGAHIYVAEFIDGGVFGGP